MIVVIGLGPIGASIGERLNDREWSVVGLEFDHDRRAAWASATGCDVHGSYNDVPWAEVSAVIIAVRLAEQVRVALADVLNRPGAATRSHLIVTTLAMSDARAIFTESHGRLFEAPLSGGPNGARDGSMTLFIAGPEETPEEQALIADMSGRVVRAAAYGEPAGLKLFNNTLGAFNALATSTILDVAAREGIDPATLLSAIGSSSGQSWMSDNFNEFHYDLLFKDAHLLTSDVGELPAISVSPSIDELGERIMRTRAALSE